MIAAIKDNKKIYIGYSDIKEYGLSLKDYSLRENIPCLIKDDLIVFFAITSASSDFLVNNEKIFEGDITVDTIRKRILPKIKALADKYHEYRGGHWNNAVVICKGDKLFLIEAEENGFYYVKEGTNSFCIAGYKEVILSVLDTEQALPPKERIKKAFEFYWQYTFNNGCALVYIDTEERQLKILNGEKGHEYNVGV